MSEEIGGTLMIDKHGPEDVLGVGDDHSAFLIFELRRCNFVFDEPLVYLIGGLFVQDFEAGV